MLLEKFQELMSNNYFLNFQKGLRQIADQYL